jgi:quercetin dioxygenase-like cupin family protein
MALKHAEPGEVVDLRPLGESLGDAKTRAIVRTGSLEAVRLVVPAGTEIPSHRVDGEITLHCIEGHAQLDLAGGAVDLRMGDWVYLAGGTPHSVRGIEDASLLLTILFDSDRPVPKRR